MKQAIDSERGKALYGRRIATVEPVFANLRYNKRLDRFTLRTQPKVNTRWHLYCLVHNIEELAHLGYGAKVAGSAAKRMRRKNPATSYCALCAAHAHFAL